MTDFLIPTRTDLNNYTMEIDLDGAEYTLGFRWNFRDSFWYLSISNADGPIVSGVKITVGTDLLANVPHEDAPPGELVATDTSGADSEPAINELGDRVRLIYSATTE